MKKLIFHWPALLIALIIIGAVFTLGGCYDSEGEGFAIYLTVGDISPAGMVALSHIETEEQPVISMKDIVTYNAQTHDLKLNAAAFERIFSLDVPVRGKSFLVCVDTKPIYRGAFWTPISSQSFDGITIWKPLSLKEPYIITIELGYPSSSFYGGIDPRNDAEVLRSFERAGKLVKKLSAAEVDKLPRSMKGYELYSWFEASQWHFNLITGTNRNKTYEEIVSAEDFISEDGWVNVHVKGIDELKAVLGKLRQDEQVIWLARPRSEQSPPGDIRFMFPSQDDIDIIKEYARQRGLDLMVQ